MLRHAREGPARCRTREAASIFPFGPQLPPNNVGGNKIGQCAGL